MTLSAADFEARYRADPDPWNYRHSAYERLKYEATLTACGSGPFRSALELGGSIGVFTSLLAPRCARLTTIDFSPTAVTIARAQLLGYPHARVILGPIPAGLPRESFDLVVASEVLYYLPSDELASTLATLERRTVPGGRLVCVHWRLPGPERPSDAAHVHALVRDQPWAMPLSSTGTERYLLDVLERR